MNKEVWKQGIKGVPYRLRIRISRKRNDEEGAKERLFSYVQAVNVKNPKGLHTTVVRVFRRPAARARCLTMRRSRRLKRVASLGTGFFHLLVDLKTIQKFTEYHQ